MRIRTAARVVALAACVVAPASAQTWRTITSARQLHGEDALTVNVTYGVGRFSLAPGLPGTLYRMEMRYDEDRFSPVREYDPANALLRLGVRDRDGSTRVSLGDRRRREGPTPQFDLTLAPDLPLDLTLELGAVESDVELGGLSVHRFEYRTGASQSRMRFSSANPIACESMHLEVGAAEFLATGLANSNCRRVRFDGGVGEVTLDFTGAWRQSMSADVTVSLGTLTLRLPRDVGVSIRLNRFLASFERAGFVKRGTTYYSENFESARQRLTLNVNATLGGVDVVWVGNDRE